MYIPPLTPDQPPFPPKGGCYLWYHTQLLKKLKSALKKAKQDQIADGKKDQRVALVLTPADPAKADRSEGLQLRFLNLCGRSEGFPRTGYFFPRRNGTGAWQISRIVRVSARAFLGGFLRCELFY